jgi:DNA replication and repair protein RecF
VPASSLEARGFRNLQDGTYRLGDGLTVVHGPNGAGKTNLLEALHFALTGSSHRTANGREMIRFGEPLARVEVEFASGSTRTAFAAVVTRSAGARQTPHGAALAPSVRTDARPAVGVFAPDRLDLVKGPPAARRVHVDRFAAALWPARAGRRRRFSMALTQRNALLRGIRTGQATTAALPAWDAEFCAAAIELIEARREALESLAPVFARHGDGLGLGAEAALAYAPRASAASEAEMAEELVARRAADLELGRSTHGPHLDEMAIRLGTRAARRYGSQGEQRLALIALLLAERDVLLGARDDPPLMLLDDLMSELDPERRALVVDALDGPCQVLITATELAQVPASRRFERLELAAGGPASAGLQAAA